jgi:hypothetical protein
MVFHIGFDQGIGRTFLGVTAAGSVFGPSLGSVSPVFDLVQRRSAPLYFPADGGGASAQGYCDRTEVGENTIIRVLPFFL